VETDSFATDSPLTFADRNPFAGTYSYCEPAHSLCHKSVLHSMSWHTGRQSIIIDILYARLFFVFSDVVYIFADDFSSLGDILLRLFSWIDIGSASSLPAAIRPQLVIVITEVNNLQLDEFLLTVHTSIQSRLADSFSSVRIFRLAGNSLSPLARYQRLREDIHLQSEESQNLRCQDHCLFSAVHLDALFRHVVQHTSATISQNSISS